MKNINDFILENISDNFAKKYKDSLNGRYVSNVSNSTWKAYQYAVGHNIKLNNIALDFMTKNDHTDSDFINAYSELWYDNVFGQPENSDISSIIVADYCFKKYNKKIFDCRTIGDKNEQHLFISYIPTDSNNKKGIMCKPCEVQCQFETSEGGWLGKKSDIHWTGDITNVKEYAEMVLNYIKQCFG